MKISVVIPYVNGPHFLEDCLESLKDQTWNDFEVLLIQDKPNPYLTEVENVKDVEDPTMIVDNYKEFFPICVYHTTTTQGVSAARNIGIANATGEYIYFLDSDDYLFHDTLEKLVMEAERTKSDLAYGTIVDTWFKRLVFFDTYEEDTKQVDTSSEEATRNATEGDDEEDYRKKLITEQAPSQAVIDLVGKKRGLVAISALNLLIRVERLRKNELFFNEQILFYADLSFVASVLKTFTNVVSVPDAKYVKRKHNDPVHYPAITQIKVEDKFNNMLTAYETTVKMLGKQDTISELLAFKLLNYYTNYFTTKIRRSEQDYWREERFTQMRALVESIPEEVRVSLKPYKKKLVKQLVKGNLAATKRMVNIHLGSKKIRNIRSNPRAFACYLYFHVFTKLKMKENWVIFESFFGKSYSDSPKYIYEYLSQAYPKQYKCIWVINDKHTEIPYGAKKVKRFSIAYAYYFARCKYTVLNVRQPNWIRKRKGNVFLETWHGTPLKRLVFDQEEVCGASPLHKQQFYRQSRDWDYLISDNRFSTDTFKRAFLFHNEIVECGYPRNDVLYAPDKEARILALKDKLGIPKDKKTILYAPTWRDDEYYGKGEYKFALKLDLKNLKKQLGEEYVILLRTHYYIADSIDITGLEDFAFNLSKYNDISELYLISDLLITDYSSVFFDYANLRRPILFFTYDLEKYRDMLRGFYLDIEKEMPGPLLFTEEDVLDAIKNIGQIEEDYKGKYDEFYERFCHVDDGNASKRIVERVFRGKKSV
ncbi:CDP-glycerol:glycerophosphate glycerophosphotransferase [Anaerosporobacter faecicola]|uniref:CDP-glycerol:glycerophosphate glycerophosphotransferase n=1 Tax=Anaerosporobacter faecicola TaxID=2718714 RepID=UPI00143BF6B1|nr:bifunctional glycosyltransferase family 2 protein/CDP-glycerol:glycerophosphate glycerophosphotransferase [Anaerosporobacter faecicola]